MVESFLQVGVLLGDGLLEDGLLELKICRQSASPGERVAGRASCRESGLQGERVVLVESLLQVGALLGDGRGAGGVGAVGGTAGPAYAFSLLSVVFVVALICLCLRLCFIVIVICFCLLRAGLDKVGMKHAC